MERSQEIARMIAETLAELSIADAIAECLADETDRTFAFERSYVGPILRATETARVALAA